MASLKLHIYFPSPHPPYNFCIDIVAIIACADSTFVLSVVVDRVDLVYLTVIIVDFCVTMMVIIVVSKSHATFCAMVCHNRSEPQM